jgi:hypothetical protein
MRFHYPHRLIRLKRGGLELNQQFKAAIFAGRSIEYLGTVFNLA